MGCRSNRPACCGMAAQQPSSMLTAHKEGGHCTMIAAAGQGMESESQAGGGLTSRWLVAQPHRCLTWVGGGQLLCKLGHARGLNCIHLSCPGLQAATVQADRPGHPTSSSWALDTQQHSTWLPAELRRHPSPAQVPAVVGTGLKQGQTVAVAPSSIQMRSNGRI